MTPAPASVPGSFTLTARAGDAKVDLSWTSSRGATEYEVLRATTSAGPFTSIKTGLTGTTYSDTGLTNETTYYYKVIASNEAGTRESAVVSAKPSKPLAQLVVQYKAADTNAADNQIKPHFNIKNLGNSPVELSDLTLRYWVTPEDNKAQQFHCDYAVVGCSNVKGSMESNYMEITFTGGTVGANGQTGEIQTRANKTDWSNYNEANDYSYDGTKTSFADWDMVTLYYKGTLVWGVEP